MIPTILQASKPKRSAPNGFVSLKSKVQYADNGESSLIGSEREWATTKTAIGKMRSGPVS
jgi:hypothetical protein